MVSNNNTKISKKIRDGLKINQATEEVPTRVATSIVPVFVSNPDREIQIASVVASDTTSVALLVASATKDTFVIGASMSTSKDAVNDGGSSTITLTPDGKASIDILHLRYEPTTAGSNLNAQISLSHSVKIQRGSTILITNGTNTASIDTQGIIYYFEVD